MFFRGSFHSSKEQNHKEMPLPRDRITILSLWISISSFISSFDSSISAISRVCELSVQNRNTIYNYSLASPIPKYPHGVQSEDGFYKIAVNETLLWFQLCDQMIFNHDPPRCFGCQDCGGPSRCGMKCGALVANNVGGYPVCETIGYATNLVISLIDEKHPQKGVVMKMFAIGHEHNCSLSVSVFCDSNAAQVYVVSVPTSLQLLGICDYVTVLRHPSGCAKVISTNGGGWGWFGTLLIIASCLLGGYLLIGTIYRFFFLGIHGAEAIPNLEFWLSIPQRVKSMLGLLVRKLRGHSRYTRGSYAPMNS